MSTTFTQIINQDKLIRNNFSKLDQILQEEQNKNWFGIAPENSSGRKSYSIKDNNHFSYANLIDPMADVREDIVKGTLEIFRNEKKIKVLDLQKFICSVDGKDVVVKNLAYLESELSSSMPNIGIGFISNMQNIGHYFAIILFKTESKITAHIYDPMMFENKGKIYEFNGVAAFQGAYAKEIQENKLLISDLSKYCFDVNNEKRCIQYYFDADACHIYSLYFLFMFASQINPNKKISRFLCFLNVPSIMDISWEEQTVSRASVIPGQNAQKARANASANASASAIVNSNVLKFKVIMVYFCGNLHKELWKSMEKCFYDRYLKKRLFSLMTVTNALESKLQ